MVVKLVSSPPSQRWLTKYIPQRCASSAIASWAWRLVPTNRIVRPSAARFVANCSASRNSFAVFAEIDDVDPVPLAEDVLLHLRVPALRLVSEVDPRLEQILQRNAAQAASIIWCRRQLQLEPETGNWTLTVC